MLLALHGIAAAGDDAAWVLDEVDAGIGGVTATAVGARLRAFAEGRQVIVITHLPQVAAMADAHYRLVKGLDEDGRATTRIEPVEGDELVEELCRMLGAAPEDAGARRHAEELLARRPPEGPSPSARPADRGRRAAGLRGLIPGMLRPAGPARGRDAPIDVRAMRRLAHPLTGRPHGAG